MQLIDIGVNLAHDSFDADRAAVVARAQAAGVAAIIVTGSSIDSTPKAIGLAAGAPGVLFATAGVHPHHASELDAEALQRLAAWARDSHVVAIGECGLDYFRDYSPRDAQRAAFQHQLELAGRVKKPLFLHQRDAHEDFVAILREHLPLPAGGVAHCFTGTLAESQVYVDMGLAIGITGWICDERRGLHLNEVVKRIPPDRLLLETDAPYLLPRDLEPRPPTRRNEPAYLPHIAAVVARARGETLEQLSGSSSAATRRLFRLPD